MKITLVIGNKKKGRVDIHHFKLEIQEIKKRRNRRKRLLPKRRKQLFILVHFIKCCYILRLADAREGVCVCVGGGGGGHSRIT